MSLKNTCFIVPILAFLAYPLIVFSEPTLTFIKQNSYPKYFEKNENKIGLCDEIYLNMKHQLEKKGIQVTIDEILYPIKRVLAMLENGSAQAFCGAGRNIEREQKYHYSKLPVYAVSNVLLTHKDNDYVALDYAELNDKQFIIGAYYGTSSARFLKKYSGIKVVDSYKTLDDAIKAVAMRKIPYFYYHDLGLVHLVSVSDLPIKLMPKKFRTVDQWMIYSKTLEPAMVEEMDIALKTLTDQGIIADINSRYFQ